MRYLWIIFVAFLATYVMAEKRDFSFFLEDGNKLCIRKGSTLFAHQGVDNRGAVCFGNVLSVQIRVLDAPEDETSPTGIYLERPFMIIDGINLDPVEKRTLTDLESDVSQVGIPNILKTLGNGSNFAPGKFEDVE